MKYAKYPNLKGFIKIYMESYLPKYEIEGRGYGIRFLLLFEFW